MTKLCPRGKAAAKRKFKVYPSKICAGKIKDPSGVKRKDFRGPKPSGAKVGMAVNAGSRSAMGRLEKSGLTKAKKGKAIAIMIAVGKPKKANEGVYIEAPKPPRRIKGKGPQRFSTEYIKKKRAYDTLVGNDRKRKRMSDPRLKNTPPQMKNGGDATIKKVIKGLHKASALHKGQAKSLQTVVKKASKGKIMQVANKLEKASKAHAGQAKTLRSIKVRGGGMAVQGMNFKGVY